MPGDEDRAHRQPFDPEDADAGIVLVEAEQRRQGHSDLGGNESLKRAVVVGAEDDPGLDAPLAHGTLGLITDETVAVTDQRDAAQVTESRRGLESDRRRRRHRQDVGIVKQLGGFKGTRPQRVHGEGQVELTVLDGLEELIVTGLLGQLDLHVWPGVGELSKEGGHNTGADALVRPHS